MSVSLYSPSLQPGEEPAIVHVRSFFGTRTQLFSWAYPVQGFVKKSLRFLSTYPTTLTLYIISPQRTGHWVRGKSTGCGKPAQRPSARPEEGPLCAPPEEPSSRRTEGPSEGHAEGHAEGQIEGLKGG
jgi:hypothetical protein